MVFLGCSSIPRIEGTGAEAEFRAAKLLRSRGLFDSSIVRFQAAATLFGMNRQHRSYIQCLNGISDNLIRKSRFAEAETLLTSITRQSFELPDRDSLAFQETHFLLAYLANYNDRFDDAVAYVDRSLNLQERLSSPSEPISANCQHLRGVILLRKGDYESALESLTHAREIQTNSAVVPVAEKALTLMTIGAVEDATGKYADAMRLYVDAMQLLKTTQQEESEFAANCYHYMAVSSRSLGEFDAAVEYEKQALTIFERLYGHQHLAVSAALAQLGDIYSWSGDYAPAREHYQEALAIMSRILEPGHSSIAEMQRKLARLALETNQLDSARALITRAASSLAKSLPNHPAMSDVYEDMGDISHARKEFEKAIGYYQHAAAIKRTIGPLPPFLDLAILFQKVGEVYFDEGRLDEASDALGRAASLQDSSLSPNPFVASAILRNLGDIQRKQGLIDEALGSYSRSLTELSTDAQNVTASKQAIDVLAARGSLLKERSRRAGGRVDDLKAAVACYDSAASLLVRLRRGYQASESKLTLQEEVLPVFNAGLSLCAEIYRQTGEKEFVNAAFRFAEFSKAAVLTETMQDAKAKVSGGVPDSLLERERRLSTIIAAAETKLLKHRHAGDSTVIGALHHRLFTARREWDQLQESLIAAFPAYKKLRIQDNLASLESVRQALAPRTALLSYALADDSLYLFTLSSKGSEFHRLGPFRRIDQAARQLRTAIKTVEPAGYLQHARFLYRSLIDPARKNFAGSTRLVVVPDGILHCVPFDVLLLDNATRSATRAQVDFTRLPYLVTSYEVTYALSGTLYREAVTGDWRPAPLEPRFAGYAPVFADSLEPPVFAQNLRGNERSLTLDGKTFAQLKFSEEEVRTIAAAFDEAGAPVAGFFHEDATKERFLATAKDYSIVHIATHGVIDEQSPGLSGILFSPPRDRQATEEDILYAGETYDLRLNADLLVLGVCESGLGKYVKGEGVMALTRGFACAGARNIAYSLWKVYDRHASTLMRRFYAHVLQGERYSSALRAAKLEMIADKSTAFPLAWAGFVLAGE
jgi:CHAT domain-containing protein/predicted negative regulator of RcsB-dependent stress response